MGLVWGGYTLLLYGYCLVKGYDIGLATMMFPLWGEGDPNNPGQVSSTAYLWPPPMAHPDEIIPSGNSWGLTQSPSDPGASAGAGVGAAGAGLAPGGPRRPVATRGPGGRFVQ